jgi:DNA invertase Pin-like site-specific DNA recombinase
MTPDTHVKAPESATTDTHDPPTSPAKDARPRVVGYVRVSTEEQASEGVSLDAQAAKLRAYADLYGLDLVAVVADAGASAKSLDRPALREALGYLDRLEATGLLVAKLDRLTRSITDLGTLLTGYFGDGGIYRLLSVADSIDTKSAAGRLVLNVLVSVAQWERETIVERTRDAVSHKRRRGERIGQVPYGMRLGPDGMTLEADHAEMQVLLQVRSWHREGWSLGRIAAELTLREVPTKRGGPRWSRSTVAGLLAPKGEGAGRG